MPLQLLNNVSTLSIFSMILEQISWLLRLSPVSAVEGVDNEGPDEEGDDVAERSSILNRVALRGHS